MDTGRCITDCAVIDGVLLQLVWRSGRPQHRLIDDFFPVMVALTAARRWTGDPVDVHRGTGRRQVDHGRRRRRRLGEPRRRRRRRLHGLEGGRRQRRAGVTTALVRRRDGVRPRRRRVEQVRRGGGGGVARCRVYADGRRRLLGLGASRRREGAVIAEHGEVRR